MRCAPVAFRQVTASAYGAFRNLHDKLLEDGSLTRDGDLLQVFSVAVGPARVRIAMTHTAQARNLPTANLTTRYSKTAGGKYNAFSCPHCGALFGDFFVEEALMYLHPDDQVTVMGRASVVLPHWCHNRGEGFCDASK